MIHIQENKWFFRNLLMAVLLLFAACDPSGSGNSGSGNSGSGDSGSGDSGSGDSGSGDSGSGDSGSGDSGSGDSGSGDSGSGDSGSGDSGSGDSGSGDSGSGDSGSGDKNTSALEKAAFSHFSHGGHKYYIIKETKHWIAAALYAKSYGGYLVHINNIPEQTKIKAELEKIKSQLVAADSTANDGGGAAYLWIGATDQTTENTWVWNGDNTGNNTQPLGTAGSGSGGVLVWHTAGVYHNWGIDPFDVQKEPDNFKDNQDSAAIAFTSWPNGKQYQWNDVKGSNILYFIVEVD